MIIDEDILKDGIDEVLLAKLIENIRLNRAIRKTLQLLYRQTRNLNADVQATISRTTKLCNHAKYIVDIAKSYLVGNPVAYSCSDGYDIEAVKNCFAVQDMPSLDAEFEKDNEHFR